MRRTGLTLLCLIGLQFVQLGANALAAAETRVALVIGNSEYIEFGQLRNPVNDMMLMAQTLRSLGFEVTERADADQAAMKRAIQEFGQRLERSGPDTVGLFYYAGHGVQISGANYLIPLNANISREPDVEIEAVNLDWVLAQMEHARNRMNILILDACRNNPLSRSFRSSEQGLGRMDAPRGTLIAYATAPGSVSFDGEGQNSPYTEALAATILEPGLVIESAFRKVRVKVMEATDDRQIPWESSSLTGAFQFNPESQPEADDGSKAEVARPSQADGTMPAAAAAPAPDRVTPAEMEHIKEPASEAELLFWASIKDSDSPDLFREYLKRFPDGVFAPIAIELLGSPKSATPSDDGERPATPSVVSGLPPQPKEPEPQQVALAPVIVAPRPFESTDLAGRWEGRYRCQDQEVGMALEVAAPRGNRVEARFEFFPAEGSPSFPSGSFQVAGPFDRDNRRLQLKAGDWIERPWGKQRHDIEGNVQGDGLTIQGRVLTTGCSEFTVRRPS